MANNFKEDTLLLRELDKMIEAEEKTAEMNPMAKDIAGALFPGLQKLLPIGEKMAQTRLDTLRRIKARLEELIEKEYA